MYVCICNAITERHLDEALSAGLSNLRQLREELGVGAECGRCARSARDYLRAALGDRTQHPAPASCLAGTYSLTHDLEAA